MTVSASIDSDKGVLVVRLTSKKEANVDLHLPVGAKKLLKTNMSVKPDGRNFKVSIPANKTIEIQYKYAVK